jgi:predicted adenylyl cyclase CyaB
VEVQTAEDCVQALSSAVSFMRNIEIKAKATLEQQQMAREYLIKTNATFKGQDHQIDTYFKVPKGRLKLRSGNIENALVQYSRPDEKGPKESKYRLVEAVKGLKEALSEALDVLIEVEKYREIYYHGITKIHLDHVVGLGYFIEIEVRDEDEVREEKKLRQQCDWYMEQFNIKPEDLFSCSYSDLLLDAPAARMIAKEVVDYGRREEGQAAP